jgi:hypothetical protein
LLISGNAGNVPYEIAVLSMFSLSATCFCVFLKEALCSIRLYGASIPVFTVMMIAICPVFFDFRNMQSAQMLFAPTYYVNALYDSSYLWHMLGYCVVLAASAWMINLISKKHLGALIRRRATHHAD